MEKLIITAAICGAEVTKEQNPNVPYTVEEIGEEADIAINCVNVQNTEMSSILPVKNGGIVYFFSMATSFTKAALGAEGIGKDVTMIVGNGYTKDHAAIALSELRENPELKRIFEEKYI